MIHILVMIHARKGGLEAIRDYESQVMPIIEAHHGRLLSAFKPRGSENVECPDEIHLIEFPSEDALDSYRKDPRVAALSDLRRSAISQTTLYISEEILNY